MMNTQEGFWAQLKPQSLTKQLTQKAQISRALFLRILQTTLATIGNEPNMLSLCSPVYVVGDIHGQFYDLLTIFNKFGWPPKTKYLFLGDYVDRGMFCIEVITLLFALKIQYPKSIHLLRGNHETKSITAHFNFRQQCLVKYDAFVFEEIMRVFSNLPLCCIIDKSYFAVHAGISPDLKSLADLQKVNRVVEPGDKTLLNDILWSDPTDQHSKLWNFNKNRNCSYYYSPYQAKKFLDKECLKLIIRGHEVQMNGHKYQKTQDKTQNLTLTVFSAPNYCGTYKNQAAVLQLEKNGHLKIETFKAVESPLILPHYQNLFEWLMPFITRDVNKIMTHLLRSHDKKNKRRKAVCFTQGTPEGLENIRRIEQVLFLEKILSQSIQTKKEELEQIKKSQKYISNVLQLTLQQFLEMKDSDILEKRPFLTQGFGPKIQVTRSLKFKIQEDHSQIQPDFIEDFDAK